MDVINEKSLSTKERNKLKDSTFGLPTQRKYPLNDESHVRKAIQFFKYCPQENRLELANNINKKLNKFNMKVKVSKENPFYKYANKKFVTESTENITESFGDIPCKFCRAIITEYVREVKKIVFYGKKTEMRENINRLEELTGNTIKKLNTCGNCVDDELELAIKVINSIADTHMVHMSQYCDYTSPNMHSYSNAITPLVNFSNSIVENFSIEDANSILESLNNDDLLRSVINRKCNNIYRDDSIDSKIYSMCSNGLHDYLKIAETHHLESFMDYTKEQSKNRIQNEIYIIDKSNENSSIDIKTPVVDINKLHKWKSKNNIKFTNLNGIDLFKFRNIKELSNIRQVFDINGKTIYIGTINESTCLLGSSTISNNVVMIELDELLEDYFSGINYTATIKVKSIDFAEKEFNEGDLVETIKSIKEGFSIDDDGNISISISPKQSYMDEYASNHKLLVENWKNKNYEGVKTNLAFAFTLIGVIERDKKFKEKDPDIIKARAFAMNDFKTYLKKIQSVEKDFDFTEYYMKNKYDKKIINIPKSTIVGIKQLLKTILV